MSYGFSWVSFWCARPVPWIVRVDPVVLAIPLLVGGVLFRGICCPVRNNGTPLFRDHVVLLREWVLVLRSWVVFLREWDLSFCFSVSEIDRFVSPWVRFIGPWVSFSAPRVGFVSPWVRFIGPWGSFVAPGKGFVAPWALRVVPGVTQYNWIKYPQDTVHTGIDLHRIYANMKPPKVVIISIGHDSTECKAL